MLKCSDAHFEFILARMKVDIILLISILVQMASICFKGLRAVWLPLQMFACFMTITYHRAKQSAEKVRLIRFPLLKEVVFRLMWQSHIQFGTELVFCYSFIDQNFSGISVFRWSPCPCHEMNSSNSTRCNQTMNQTPKTAELFFTINFIW